MGKVSKVEKKKKPGGGQGENKVAKKTIWAEKGQRKNANLRMAQG